MKLFIAIMVLLILINIYAWYANYNEYFDQPSATPTPPATAIASAASCAIKQTDNIFFSEYVGPKKLVNFKTTFGGKDYFLATMSRSDCAGIGTKDCFQQVLILVEATEINSGLKTYKDSLDKAQAVCNAGKKVDCSKTANANCPTDYPDCVQPRQYIHDFTVSQVASPDPSKPHRYVVKGTSAPLLNGISSASTISSNTSYVCGDPVNGVAGQLCVLEKETEGRGGIIGGLSGGISVKLFFNLPALKYLGACASTLTCKKNNVTYIRICTYDNMLDPNVLNFTPMVV